MSAAGSKPELSHLEKHANGRAQAPGSTRGWLTFKEAAMSQAMLSGRQEEQPYYADVHEVLEPSSQKASSVAADAGTGGASRFRDFRFGSAATTGFTGCSASAAGAARFRDLRFGSAAATGFTGRSASAAGAALFRDLRFGSAAATGFTGCSASAAGAAAAFRDLRFGSAATTGSSAARAAAVFRDLRFGSAEPADGAFFRFFSSATNWFWIFFFCFCLSSC